MALNFGSKGFASLQFCCVAYQQRAPEKVELQGSLVVEVLVTTMPLIAMSVLFNHKGLAMNSIGLGPPGQFEHHQTGCTHWPKADPRCDCIQACGQKVCSTQIWPCVLFLLNCDYRKFSHSLWPGIDGWPKCAFQVATSLRTWTIWRPGRTLTHLFPTAFTGPCPGGRLRIRAVAGGLDELPGLRLHVRWNSTLMAKTLFVSFFNVTCMSSMWFGLGLQSLPLMAASCIRGVWVKDYFLFKVLGGYHFQV